MAKVENVERLLAAFRKREDASRQAECVVRVGFSALYAIYVHEDLAARHPTGQAKFLEQPYRQMMPELRGMILSMMRSKITMCDALLAAGMRLLGESQALCPVDTGNLRASGYCRVEGPGES